MAQNPGRGRRAGGNGPICGRGDFRITSFQQYDLFPDIEEGMDNLAVHLGGVSLSDATAQDERTEDEKIIESLFGKAISAFYADNFETNSLIIVYFKHSSTALNT